jgi:hypothetical protein
MGKGGVAGSTAPLMQLLLLLLLLLATSLSNKVTFWVYWRGPRPERST